MEHEIHALAMVAVGMFEIDRRDGAIWKCWELDHAGMPQELPRPIRAEVQRGEYLRVQFTVQGRRYWVSAHRLIWMIANRRTIAPGMEVNHKNGAKTDNRPANLEVVTKAQNAAHAIHVLGKIKSRKHPGAKLTPQQVLEIDAALRAGDMTKAAIARHYGVTAKTVSNIASRKKWQELLAASTG